MVMFDKLPMRDVLVERLGWSEEDARAFLDVLEAPVDNLATKEDIAVLRSELDQVKAELHTVRTDGALSQNDVVRMRRGIREEGTEPTVFGDRFIRLLAARLDEDERRQQARNAALFASISDMVSKHYRRTYILIGGVWAILGGMMIAILV